MTVAPTLSIVLVTYNSAHLLAQLQASFDADPAGKNYEYIVVDNASDDATAHAMPHAHWACPTAMAALLLAWRLISRSGMWRRRRNSLMRWV